MYIQIYLLFLKKIKRFYTKRVHFTVDLFFFKFQVMLNSLTYLN